jgi:hypothetical protein
MTEAAAREAVGRSDSYCLRNTQIPVFTDRCTSGHLRLKSATQVHLRPGNTPQNTFFHRLLRCLRLGSFCGSYANQAVTELPANADAVKSGLQDLIFDDTLGRSYRD